MTAIIEPNAERRYHLDAEFHAEVDEAVARALYGYPFLSESERQFARRHAVVAAAVALNRRDSGRSEANPAIGRWIEANPAIGRWIDVNAIKRAVSDSSHDGHNLRDTGSDSA